MTKSRIELTFFTNAEKSEFDPTTVAGLIGFNGDVSTGIINRQMPGKNSFFKESFWEWRSEELETYVVDDLFELMFDLFNPKIDILKGIKNRYSLQTKLFITIHVEKEEIPGVSFHRKILNFLNELEGEIDIDMYII